MAGLCLLSTDRTVGRKEKPSMKRRQERTHSEAKNLMEPKNSTKSRSVSKMKRIDVLETHGTLA